MLYILLWLWLWGLWLYKLPAWCADGLRNMDGGSFYSVVPRTSSSHGLWCCYISTWPWYARLQDVHVDTLLWLHIRSHNSAWEWWTPSGWTQPTNYDISTWFCATIYIQQPSRCWYSSETELIKGVDFTAGKGNQCYQTATQLAKGRDGRSESNSYWTTIYDKLK